MQVLILVGTFILGFHEMKNTIFEIKSLEMLANKNEGEAWE